MPLLSGCLPTKQNRTGCNNRTAVDGRDNQLTKLNAAIERLSAERKAASELSEQLWQRIADDRAEAEQEDSQAVEFATEWSESTAQRTQAERAHAAEIERAAANPVATFITAHSATHRSDDAIC